MTSFHLLVNTPNWPQWSSSPDFAQVMRHSQLLGDVAALLVDSHRLFLIDPAARKPRSIIERSAATRADLVRSRITFWARQRERREPPASSRVTAWTLRDLERELERFECELTGADLRPNRVQTYVGRTATFLAWLEGD